MEFTGCVYNDFVAFTQKNTFGNNEFVGDFCERFNSEVATELASSPVRKFTMKAPGIFAPVRTNSLKKYNSPRNLPSKLAGQVKKLEGALAEGKEKKHPPPPSRSELRNRGRIYKLAQHLAI